MVRYASPIGELAAYASPDPGDGQRHPAIVWLAGEFSSGLGELAWTPGPAENDQSATAYREAGILMMYPSLRGAHDNPGDREAFYGEVDDVLAAAAYLAELPYVDRRRIYLAGHSTGGTLALLVAEVSDRFRAIFVFGPVADVASYGEERLPFDLKDNRERELRSPVHWLAGIRTPTYVIEGNTNANVSDVLELANTPHPECVQFHLVKHADHFSVLQPVTRLIARKILADVGAKVSFQFSDEEFNAALGS